MASKSKYLIFVLKKRPVYDFKKSYVGNEDVLYRWTDSDFFEGIKYVTIPRMIKRQRGQFIIVITGYMNRKGNSKSPWRTPFETSFCDVLKSIYYLVIWHKKAQFVSLIIYLDFFKRITSESMWDTSVERSRLLGFKSARKSKDFRSRKPDLKTWKINFGYI